MMWGIRLLSPLKGCNNQIRNTLLDVKNCDLCATIKFRIMYLEIHRRLSFILQINFHGMNDVNSWVVIPGKGLQ